MPITVQLPDGNTAQFPDGMKASDIEAVLQKQYKPVSVGLGETLREIPRQIGLTARAGVSGALDIADLLATPFRAGLEAVTGQKIAPTADMVPNMIGLPQPKNADERTAQAGARFMAGAAAPIGIASKLQPVTEIGQSLRGLLTSGPTQQVVSGGAGGVASQSVQEAGGGSGEQAAAGLAAGLLAPLGFTSAGRAIQSTKQTVQRTAETFKPQLVEQKVNQVLQNSGVSLSDLPAEARAALRVDVENALKTNGTISQDAIARLAKYRSLNVTPTRGTVTLDPVIVTQQKNAAKRGANSNDPYAQQLSQLENQNNQKLLGQLDEVGGGDIYSGNEQIINTLGGFVDSAKARIKSLYDAAKGSEGRNLELEPFTFTQNTGKALDRELKTKFLPAEIKSILNDIAEGKIPLTVDVSEQLKTMLGAAQRGSTDGNVRSALGIVRQQLEQTPLRQGMEYGQQTIDAFNKARQANKQFMDLQEKIPALKSIVEGEALPDNFFEKFVLRAPASQVEALLKVGQEPVRQQIKNQVVQYLRDQATGGKADELAKLSGITLNKQLKKLGSAKLDLIFKPEELNKLRTIGDVASYEQFQPVGSAVNNSNTAAAIGGWITQLAQSSMLGKLPLGMLVQEPAKNIALGMEARSALNASKGLTSPLEQQKVPYRASIPALGLLSQQ